MDSGLTSCCSRHIAILREHNPPKKHLTLAAENQPNHVKLSMISRMSSFIWQLQGCKRVAQRYNRLHCTCRATRSPYLVLR
ncbi:hypothetical protein M3J09_003461 [Ascochyta lentis]